jgi:hypothetical protein
VPSIAIGDTNSGIYASASGQISITTQGTQRLNIDGNGNVTVSALAVSGDITVGNDIYVTNGNFLKLQRSSGGLYLDVLGNESGTDDIRLLSSGNFKFVNGSLSELMRITSGGDVLVGTTSINGEGGITVRSNASGGSNGAARILFNRANTTSISSVIEFNNNNSPVGSITYTNTATSYNETSDYRLKENVVPITGALDRVDALKPSRFNFIADADTTVDGFLAHELAEVVPEAVTGEKDAVDEEGNAIYQGIDKGKIVPLLVGAIQELRAEIETLKSQINN